MSQLSSCVNRVKFPCLVASYLRCLQFRSFTLNSRSFWTDRGHTFKGNTTNRPLLAEYNQQDATFHNLFISVRRSTCLRRFRPSSGAQNCTYSVRYLSDQYLTLYLQFWATDEGRKNRLKHVERLTGINKLWIVASCWLYFANILAIDGPVNINCPLLMQDLEQR